MPIKVGKKKLYSVEDLTKMLPITPLTIREYIRKGKMKGHKIGKNWYVSKEDLERFLDGRGQEGEGIAKSKVET
jgi:excisionase family DNA binding protein